MKIPEPMMSGFISPIKDESLISISINARTVEDYLKVIQTLAYGLASGVMPASDESYKQVVAEEPVKKDTTTVKTKTDKKTSVPDASDPIEEKEVTPATTTTTTTKPKTNEVEISTTLLRTHITPLLKKLKTENENPVRNLIVKYVAKSLKKKEDKLSKEESTLDNVDTSFYADFLYECLFAAKNVESVDMDSLLGVLAKYLSEDQLTKLNSDDELPF